MEKGVPVTLSGVITMMRPPQMLLYCEKDTTSQQTEVNVNI